MSEIFLTNFTARLVADITAADTVFVLSSVPDDAPAGTYRFRFGHDPRNSEWLQASYPGAGTTFTNAQRGNEGGNPAVAWFAGTPVSHTLTGLSFSGLRGDVAAQLSTQPDPLRYVRSTAERAFLDINFT